MKYLHSIGESQLIQWIRDNYALAIINLIPVEQGAIGDNYIAVSATHEQYFLKIYLQSKLVIDHPQGLETILGLLSNLHEQGIDTIPYPLKTKNNDLAAKLGEYVIVLSKFIDGTNPEVTSEIAAKFAKLITRIHQVDSKVSLPLEPFDTSYAIRLSEQLKNLEEGGQLTDNQRKLKDVLLPHKQRLLKHLKELNRLCEKVRTTKKHTVITHGDLILDNLLIDKNGEVFIVDWDTARLAPPERDIWFFMNDYGEDFIKSYKEVNANISFDPELVSYFMYKRYLEDIVYWTDEILVENISSEQAAASIEGIRVSCLEAYKDIEQKIENIYRILY
jgi:spectinomycin phosphotransferase